MKNVLHFLDGIRTRTAVFTSIISLLVVACAPKPAENNEIPVTSSSEEAVSHFNQGLDLSDVGNGVLARAHYDKAIELDPTFASAYLRRALGGSSTEQFKADIELAEANLEGKSEGEKILIQLYKTGLKNDTDERLKLAQDLVNAYPKSARALTIMGNAQAIVSNHQSAREYFQKAIDMAPNWVGGYFNLGTSLMTIKPKDLAKAEQNFSKVVELRPDLPGSHIYLGDAYRAQNNLEKARDTYQKAIELSADDPLNYYKRGHIYAFLGSYDEARADYRKASELSPNEKINPIVFEANTYVFAGDNKTAKTWLEEQANSLEKVGVPEHQITSGRLTLLANCANIAFHNGEAAEVVRYIEMMRPLSEAAGQIAGTEEAKLGQKANILGWEATALALKGDYAGATAKAEEMKATLEPVKNPNKLWGYNNIMCFIAYKQGKFEEAVSYQEQSNPNAPYNRYWLAKSCEKAGQIERANQLYDELMIENTNNLGYALIRDELIKRKSPA